MGEIKNIDYRFKILYAIGMILVVASHTNGGGLPFLMRDWFAYETVDLALFFFCSGYFYKNMVENEWQKYIAKKFMTLIVPLYIYNLFYGVFVAIMHKFGFGIGGDFTLYNLFVAPINNGHQFVYNMGGWFLIPLFMVQVFNVVVRKAISYIKNDVPEGVIFAFYMGLGILGNELAIKGYFNGWWLVLVRMLYFLPFFGLGTFYKKVLEKRDNLESLWYFMIIFVIKLVMMYVYVGNMNYQPSWCNNFIDGPLEPIIVGLLGIAFWLRVAKIFEPAIGKSKYVNMIADNTYSIMINQFLGFMLIKSVFAFIFVANLGFNDFNMLKYKNDIWWYYLPHGFEQMNSIYVVFGIVVPIIIQKMITSVKRKIIKA